MDGEAVWLTTSGNIGLPPLARVMGVGRQQQLEVMLERNKLKVAVIQESKLSPKSKNPCIQNYTTVRKTAPMVKEEDC